MPVKIEHIEAARLHERGRRVPTAVGVEDDELAGLANRHMLTSEEFAVLGAKVYRATVG